MDDGSGNALNRRTTLEAASFAAMAANDAVHKATSSLNWLVESSRAKRASSAASLEGSDGQVGSPAGALRTGSRPSPRTCGGSIGGNEDTAHSDLLSVHIATWNVGNAAPPDDLKNWLPPGGNGDDIVVICAQEATYSHTAAAEDVVGTVVVMVAAGESAIKF
jgi:hypothetical protein